MIVTWSCVILLSVIQISQSAPENLVNSELDTLVFLHVLFRHGNRTSEKLERYPKDPYLNYSYYPFGDGQLTVTGKRREYSIGKALRKRYARFLGDYYQGIVEPVSTEYNRTKESLELVLASLFPPRSDNIWNENLKWNPIPYNYYPRAKDKVLLGLLCPTYVKLYEEVVASEGQQREFRKHQDVFDYVSYHTGLNATTYSEFNVLFFGLQTEEEWGLKLPTWTKKVWPKIVKELAIKEYFVQTSSKELKSIATGYFIQKILNDTQTRIQTMKVKFGQKVNLFSAHEVNIAHALILLGVFDRPHIPNYGAYLVFEVHYIKNTYGFKIFYQNYDNSGPRLLKLPDCDEFCPLEKFVSLYKDYLPSSDLCGV